jgi:gp6-like head-tail connector protein
VTATIYYDGTTEQALLSASFTLGGSGTDPASVSCVVTDPSGNAVTHTYLGALPADVARDGEGSYQLVVTCSPAVAGVDGLWSYVWIASGTVNDIQPGTWRVLPTSIGTWYIGLDEFKDRLGITDNTDDFQAQLAIQGASQAVNNFCGRHFWRLTEPRSFEPNNVWLLDVDDIVPGAACQVNLDMNGDGIYELPLTQGTDYILRYGRGMFNQNFLGESRPYRQLQIIQTGNWLPFTWPFARLDRVQIITTWGWPAVPAPVTTGAFILAQDLFSLRNAPFGILGMADLGISKIKQNPMLTRMLERYINARHKIGV